MSGYSKSQRRGKMPSHRRKKLWEIYDGHHCSIIGTCLHRVDLRRFAKKKLFQVSSGATDYQIHKVLIGIAANRNRKSRALHKFLDQRYRAALKRYGAIEEDGAIRKLWKQDVERGAVAGAYWAIMSRHNLSNDLRTEVYGELHMMSHDIVIDQQNQRRLNEEIANKAKILEDVLVSERQLHIREKKQLIREIEDLQEREKEVVLLAEQKRELMVKNEQLALELSGASLASKVETLERHLEERNRINAELCAENEVLQYRVTKMGEALERVNNRFVEEKAQKRTLKAAFDDLREEIESMESAMVSTMESSETNCLTCVDNNTSRCPGPDLCGKTILYVGGLHKLVAHYRQLVERHGGKFIHHDGGKEASRAALPRMLSGADAVLCPIDCVSHDACNRVKKICKQYHKPYVMMRSSGLSSLAKGLSQIVQ